MNDTNTNTTTNGVSTPSGGGANPNPGGGGTPVVIHDPNLAQCLVLLGQATTAHDASPGGGAALTPHERKTILRLPPKGAKLVTGLASLWETYGAAMPTVQLGQMSADLTQSQEVRAVLRAAKRLARTLEDDAMSVEKKVWTTATQIYTVLQTFARTDKTLVVALEPYAEYFAEPAKTRAVNAKNGTTKRRPKKVPAAGSTAAASTTAHAGEGTTATVK